MSAKRKAFLSFSLITGVLIMWLSLPLPTAWAQDENVAKAQRILSALGYDPGKADGVMGPRTRRAIAAYQRSYNLPPTSELDEPTRRSLGLLDVPQAPEIPPAPKTPPTPWRTVLAYLKYYDTQPSRLVPYLTEHFRQGLQAQAWIRKTMKEIAAQKFSRLSWRIERVDPLEAETALEATVEVYSRVRILGEEKARREIFSLLRQSETAWLIHDLKSLAVSESNSQALKPDQTTAGR